MLLLAIALGSLTTFAVQKPTLCPPGTLRPIIQTAEARRGVSSHIFSEVEKSPSTQAYLQEHMNFEPFPSSNHPYLALLTQEELSTLQNLNLSVKAQKNKIPHKFVFLSFNPLRELNNTYFHGHLEFSDAVNNHAKKLNAQHLMQELNTGPNLRQYLSARYNDYKSVAFAFAEPGSSAKSAQIDQSVERAVRNASYQFAAEYLLSDLALLTRGQRESIADPARWISAGIGDTHDQAAIAARYARDLKTTQKALNFREIRGQINEDLQKIQSRSKSFRAAFPKDSPLFDPRTPGLLSLKVFQVLRSVKSSDVEMAANENLRTSLNFSFPNLRFNDAQIAEIRSALTLPMEDRVHFRVSELFATPEFFQSKFVIQDIESGALHLTAEALGIMQEERDFKAYFTTVNKMLQQRFGMQLDEPMMLELRSIVNQIDRFSVPVLQESRNPIAFDQGKLGFIAGDFSGLGARNLFETQDALLRADSAENAVAGARQAFNRASQPLFEMQKRFRKAITKFTRLSVDESAFTGDEMSVPLQNAKTLPNMQAKGQILRALVDGSPYPASDVRLSFGEHFKEAQDLEKRLRAILQANPELQDWAEKTALAVDVQTDAKGRSTLHLIPSQAIPRGKKTVLEGEFRKAFQAGDPFVPGKILPLKESRTGASLRLDFGIPRGYPSSRPEQTRLEVA